MMPWHRLFGVPLSAYVKGSEWVVELEKDLSELQQLLDVLIIRRGSGTRPIVWPHGFHPVNYNLITFKSMRDALTLWSFQELVGHYVNYRKMISPSWDALIPEDQFALFAASVRFPRDAAKKMDFQERGPGIYDVVQMGLTIRVLVFSQIPEATGNALWNLFSGDNAHVAYGYEHLRPRLAKFTTVLEKLLNQYDVEGLEMPYSLEQFEREHEEEILSKLGPKILSKMTPKERLAGMAPEQFLAGLDPRQRQRFRDLLDQPGEAKKPKKRRGKS